MSMVFCRRSEIEDRSLLIRTACWNMIANEIER